MAKMTINYVILLVKQLAVVVNKPETFHRQWTDSRLNNNFCRLRKK